MSAWIVTKGHIDTLVQALVTEGLIPMQAASETGVLLWEENRRSVAYRYPDDADGEWPGPIGLTIADIQAYRFSGIEARLSPAIVQQQWHCFNYQSCEHEEWQDSEAYRLFRAYVDLLELRHGESFEDRAHPTNGRLPWGVDSIEECVAP